MGYKLSLQSKKCHTLCVLPDEVCGKANQQTTWKHCNFGWSQQVNFGIVWFIIITIIASTWPYNIIICVYYTFLSKFHFWLFQQVFLNMCFFRRKWKKLTHTRFVVYYLCGWLLRAGESSLVDFRNPRKLLRCSFLVALSITSGFLRYVVHGKRQDTVSLPSFILNKVHCKLILIKFWCSKYHQS